MRLQARFAALYGWCPQVRGLSSGEVELGLMANMTRVNAAVSIGMAQGIGGALNGEAMASLAETAGAPEREVIKLRMQSAKNDLQNGQGSTQWQ